MQEFLFEKNVARANQLGNYKLYDFCHSIQDANEKILDEVSYTGSNIIQFLSINEKIKRFLQFHNYKTYLFIFMVSSIGSIIFILLQKLILIV